MRWLDTILGKNALRPGDVLSGESRYLIVSEIASGGMGTVYRARLLGAAGFEKTVAVKTLKKELAADGELIGNFVDEAKLVAHLVHENIVQIYQLEHGRHGYFFVLELVDGITLRQLLEHHAQARVRLPMEWAVFITAQIARALAYAHNFRAADGTALHIVHRDICIHNIMINREGVPKLMDFGVAKSAIGSGPTRNSGKLDFMPPEQLKDHIKVDFRGDIYSLGIVFFWLLSSQSPRNPALPGEDKLAEIADNRLRWELLPADLPPPVLAMLHTMLATDPAARYDDTAELLFELESYIYADGYGPTIVKLAAYLRNFLPGIFGSVPLSAQKSMDVTQKL